MTHLGDRGSIIFSSCLLLVLAGAGLVVAADTNGDVVFRTDVSLVRVDAQVLDHNNRTITGLRAEDFALLDEGKPRQIRDFVSENMPVDVLLLLDVSTSMRPHVERIAAAAHEALRVLSDKDRMAIMVFDRSTRLRLRFQNSRTDIEDALESLLRKEKFNGGTDITRGLLDAAKYVEREGRSEARRAIVIVTDDQTERNRDEAAVSSALLKANAVLCALIAPDAMRYMGNRPGRPGAGEPQDGPLPGGPLGGPLGGIIFGRRGGRGPYGGGPAARRPHTQSAGTAEIARQSGGDSMSVDDASALETTLARIRQRYALYFYVPEGVKPGQERTVEVKLADAARQHYPDAELLYRHVYVTPDSSTAAAEPTIVSQAPINGSIGNAGAAADTQTSASRRHPAVSEPQGPAGPRAGSP
jgi:VWFA-related protein